jgi:hypothetical protein
MEARARDRQELYIRPPLQRKGTVVKLWASLAFFGFVTYIQGDEREESEIGGRATPRGTGATLTQKSAKAGSQEKKSRPLQQRQALAVKSSKAEANTDC